MLVSQHFIQWIHDRDLTLATTHQEHIDRWLVDGNSTSRYVKPFLAWAAKAGLAPHLTIAENRPSEHRTAALEDNTRLRLLHRLIHDDTIEPRARVPALLILVYGQPLARVARMRTDQITTNDDTTTIQLGRDHIVLPDPIDQLVRDFAAQPRRRTLHDATDSAWLFPGQKACAPIAPEGLRRRLNKQFPNMPIRPGRSSAVMTLLRDVPPPILADLLGFSQHRAHRWATLAATSHAQYVANRITASAERTDPPDRPSGRRVTTPAAGRFATSKSSPERQLRRVGDDDVLACLAMQVD